MPDDDDQAAAVRRFAPQALDLSRIEVGNHRLELLERPRRKAHQLDEIAAIPEIRAEGHRADPVVVGRQPQDVPEVTVGPATLRRPGEVRQLRGAPDHACRLLRRHGGEDPGQCPIAGHGQTLDDARARTPASMRCLQSAVAGPRAGLRPVVGGHEAVAVATLAGAPASLRSLRFSGFSVPTSVSLSSPRMNASSRL